MRLFIAIPFKDQTKKLLKEKINKAHFDIKKNLKWVRAVNLHLTLKFLGETDPNKITDIKKVITNTCSNFLEFNIYFDHFGAFPSLGYPKVLYFGINDKNNQLIKVQNDLENRLYKFGFNKDKREYTPHLTFARTRNSTNIKNLKNKYNNFIQETDLRIFFNIKNISLIESKLYKSGPVYKELFTDYLK